jgi:hypothetical protein
VLCPPAAALALLPLFLVEIAAYWPALEPRSVLGAQVEQETCVSLASPHCWNPRAELKTDREYGFGLGQFTRTDRFDTFSELRQRYARELAGWTWEGRYDARYQLRALVLADRDLFQRCEPLMASARDRHACMASAYNGGFGGFTRDRMLCANTVGCDRARWFGNVETTSYKARASAAGYRVSFYDVNRTYVRNVLDVRRPRYEAAMDQGGCRAR